MQRNAPTSARIDESLRLKVDEWLDKNNIGLSRLVNIAIAKFISEVQSFEPVEVVAAKDDTVKKSAKKMISKHKKVLERLE